MSFTPKPTIEIPPWLDTIVSKTIKIGKHIIDFKKLIGIGCQGNVYAGVSNLHGDVAIKEIKSIIFPEIHYKAESLGIGPIIFDVHYEGNNTFIIMERLVRTLTLKDMEIAMLNFQLCELITILIENGIFHNDLRDTNVMFDRRGNIKIIDYDSAKLAFSTLNENIHLLSEQEYSSCLQRNYYIYINNKKYVLNYDYVLQKRHHQAYERFIEIHSF